MVQTKMAFCEKCFLSKIYDKGYSKNFNLNYKKTKKYRQCILLIT